MRNISISYIKKLFACMLLITTVSNNAFGESTLKYDFDNKVIFSSGISLPQSASLLQVLQVLPELLHRPNDNILENYDLKIEGLSVGDSKDAILSQILLMDIEKIEITNSSTSNYESNGQGGGINVKLKKLKQGTSGNAFAMLGLPSDYVPGVSLNNKSEKWAIRSFLTGEVFNQEDIATRYHTTMAGQTALGSEKETLEDKSKLHQMAKVYAFYTGSKDELKFSFSEMMDKSINTVLQRLSSTTRYTQKDNSSRNLSILFKTEYNHQFAWNGSATIEALYNYAPTRNKMTLTHDTDMFSQADDNEHSISGKVEYSHFIYWGEGGNQKQGSKGYVRFLPGCKYNYSYKHAENDQQLGEFIPSTTSTHNNLFISPYLTMKSSIGKLNFMANIEYQIYHYRLDATQMDETEEYSPMNYDVTEKNFVGALITIWNINQHHTLRLMANRSLKRPTESQMFPFMLYSASNLRIEQGNADLKPMIMNTLELEYLFTHDTGTHKWEMSLGGRYIHTIDDINTITQYDKEIDDDLTTWNNANNDNILNFNAMLSWKHKWLGIMATGNFFNRHTIETGVNHRYFNVSVMPQIQTNNGWNVCLMLRHNTKLVRNSTDMPSLNILTMIVSKTWSKKLTTFLSGTLSTTHRIDEVTTLSDNALETKNYVPVNDTIYASLRYNF